ncbi:hypothetical protein F66182_852 [Fusarium sp. NRRL 66182]|nr:hypothetical protein F66182_852 [Fusarium sp. NRRL 66182]
MGCQSRQRPVSCHFCRLRKLRCSRVFPCDNCTSRGVQCQPQDPPRTTAPGSRPVAKRKGSHSTDREADILSRLERLEALLAERNTASEPGAQTSSTGASSTEGHEAVPPRRLEPQQPLPLNVQNLTADALWLERTCLGPKPSESVLVDGIVFRICPIRMVTQSSCYLFQSPNVPSGFMSLEPTKCIWLPEREETRVLVNKYTTVITYLHHVIHCPSVSNLVDVVYDSIERGENIQLCSVFLLLAICTKVTYSWTVIDNDRTELFSDFLQANNQAFSWLKSALDVFDAAQRRADIALESAQGLVIISFVLMNLEGISVRARNYLFQAITIGRELGLHRLDHPHNPSVHLSGLKAEVGRRVWWYLVATDTMLARFSGLYEGAYLINTKHMTVRKPLNANDEDLMDGKEMVEQPISQPTSMSYFLQRLRLSELVRESIDRTPLSSSTQSSAQDSNAYALVLEIDAAVERYLEDLPSFLKADVKDLEKLPPTDARRRPDIAIQRHTMKLLVHGQRCKFHLPYFARGAVEPEYAHSRRVCLDSARRVIRTEVQLDMENFTYAATRLRLCVIMHSVFISSIVVLLDLILGADPQEKELRRQELNDAWKIFEAAKDYSKPTARLQDLLRHVMKKHNVSLPVGRGSEQCPPKSTDHEDIPLTDNSSSAATEISTPTAPNDNRLSTQELNDFGLNMDLDGMDWEGLLWGLDAPMF